MRSFFEQAIGKRISLLAGVLVLMSSQMLHAQDDLTTQALVSTLTGEVHILSVDKKGIIDSVTEPDRMTGIDGGSNGIALGDFDNDGFIDYLIGGHSSAFRQACIELQRGVETENRFELGEVIFPSDWTRCTSVMDFAVADYNRDDNLDFAVSNFCSMKTHLYLGNGDGTFQCTNVFELPFYAFGIDAEDLDEDGNADFIAVNWSGPFYYELALEVYFGDGTGGFRQETILLDSPYTYNYPYVTSRGISLGDFDGDGTVDVVVNCTRARYTDGKLLSFYRGWGDGSFERVPLVSGKLKENGSSITAVLSALGAADFNLDGCLDIIGTHYDATESVVYLGSGDGTFTLSSQKPVAWFLTGLSILPFENSNTAPVANPGGAYAYVTEDVLLDIDPDTFNKKTNGKWVTAYLQADHEGKARVTLDGGTDSYDPDGDSLTYLWSVVDETHNEWILEGSQPTVELSPGHYTVALVVNDGRAYSQVSSTTLDVDVVEVSSLVGSEFFLNDVPSSRSVSSESYLMIKFDRERFGKTLEVGRNIPVYLTGSARGADVIRVIDSSKNGRAK